MKLSINYRVDRRIKVVEIRRDKTVFLVSLDIFMIHARLPIEGIIGSVKAEVSVEQYNTLSKNRMVL